MGRIERLDQLVDGLRDTAGNFTCREAFQQPTVDLVDNDVFNDAKIAQLTPIGIAWLINSESLRSIIKSN